MVEVSDVQKLRQKTGAGVMDCKRALDESNGDFNKAIEYLRKQGQEIALKKVGREVKEGLVGFYIHPNQKIGVLVEVLCETDFVARNEEFQSLAKDLAMHIAASDPKYLSPADIPEEVLDKEREIYEVQAKSEGKPPEVLKKVVDGKIAKFAEEVSLLTQPFFKNPQITVRELITQKIAKIGENIKVGKFVRYSLQ